MEWERIKQMIKCWFCKYKSVCRPEMEYKLTLKKEGELFRKWWNVEYKKGKDKDENNKSK